MCRLILINNSSGVYLEIDLNFGLCMLASVKQFICKKNLKRELPFEDLLINVLLRSYGNE